MLDGWPLIARFVLGGVLAAIGVVAATMATAILKEAWDSWKAKSQPTVTSASPSIGSPAALLFKCELAKLPSTVPPSGRVSTMDIVSKLEMGAEPWGLGTRHGQPGEKWEWFKDGEISLVSRCDITNYADFPIFNVVMVFKEEFRAAMKPQDNPAATKSGDIVDSSDRTVIIDNIDAKSTFTFYAYSQSRYFVSVKTPTAVNYLRAGSDAREEAKILPAVFGWMSFSPRESNPGPETPPPGATVH
ncbi:hypothetical protein [Bradyrhizobium sp. CB2312]|uniref:hypothetical protein n=1 Tax=Bradyrhizobium sp. CB2312 TaxID=3039155 RepID=UPI0024B05A1D|nr:hypothetical protein [Bradyrhizobium sp. CB2312]WFU69433.1 hypothetical protein QA642_29640 [Bradyrhizobium sp. CB2312]